MTTQDSVPADVLARIFPFHFVVDRELRVAALGPRLPRLLPPLALGASLDAALAVERPPVVPTWNALAALTDRLVVFRGLPPFERVVLRGQVLELPAQGRLLFVGGPWLTSLDDLAPLGLRLNDFPAHDPLGDMLVMMQGKNAALADAEELAGRLAEKSRTLAERAVTLQDELLRAEALASLGRLVAGVAHEINTPLGVARMSATVVGDEVERFARRLAEGGVRKSEVEAHLATCREAADLLTGNLQRAADLVRQFKSVAVDRVTDQRRRVNLVAYVREVLGSLRPMLRRAQVEVDLVEGEPCDIVTYPGAIAQIVTNLAENVVMHAYPDGKGGVWRLSAGAIDSERAFVESSDLGVGMDDAVRARVFEPFFTTRRSTGGTGLGMHIVHNLVHDALGGTVSVESAPGRGTKVRLEVPREPPAVGAG